MLLIDIDNKIDDVLVFYKFILLCFIFIIIFIFYKVILKR